MQIMIFIRIHRINFQPDYFEIFSCDLTRLTNIFHIGLYTALSGKNQNFLETGLCDCCHLFVNFLCIQLCTANFIVAVKTAVDAVIFTVVCDIDWCKHIYTVSKMFSCLHSRRLRDLFQKWKCRRRKKCLEVLNRPIVMFQCSADILFCILIIIIGIHRCDDLFHNIGLFHCLHSRKIFHMIDTVFFHIFQNYFIDDTLVKMFAMFCCI